MGWFKAAQKKGIGGISQGFVMDYEILLGDAVFAQGHDLGCHPLESNPLVAVLAEDQRAAMLQRNGVVGARVPIRHLLKGVVVKDDAILVNLDEGAPLVVRGLGQYLTQVPGIGIDGTRGKRGLGPQGNRDGVHRIVDGTMRR